MGLITTHSTTIDGVNYTTSTYPAMLGLELMGRMSRCVSASHLKLLVHEDMDGSLSVEQLTSLLSDPATIAQIGLHVIQRAAELGDMKLARDLLAFTESPDGIQIGAAKAKGSVHEHFDDHFAGRYGHMLKVCIWAARVGFGAPLDVGPSKSTG